MTTKSSTVLVTGGAGYVGSLLVPRLLAEGYRVKILDLYLFGEDVFDSEKDNEKLTQFKGDFRDLKLLKSILPGCKIVIHLACNSNDPCFEIDPQINKSINYDAFRPLVEISKKSGVRRFIYASASSAYGVSDAPKVCDAAVELVLSLKKDELDKTVEDDFEMVALS